MCCERFIQWSVRDEELVDSMAKRRQKMIAEGSLILADLSKQASNNSYGPPTEYRDTEFNCRDCGKAEVWTAKQQQWWYEVAKGPIQAGAIRCQECRRIDRLVKKAAQSPLSKKPIAVVMDTDDSRIRRMTLTLSKLAPELVPVSRLTTDWCWDQGFWHVLPAARLLSLSCEWLSRQDGNIGKRGEFLEILLHKRLRRPVLFHGTSTAASRDAVELLRKARWNVVEVHVSKADWIESDWRDAVSSLLK